MNFPNPHLSGCFWHNSALKFGAAENKLCEEVTCGIIAGPSNTWSNLAYLIVAIYLWKKDKSFSLFVFFLGVFSFLAHTSLIYPTFLFDLGMSMALVAWFLGKKLKLKNFYPFVGVWFLLSLMTFHFLLKNHLPYSYLFPLCAFGLVVLEFIYPARWKKDLFLAVGFVGVAFLFAAIDGLEGFCRPDSWLQGHALWHLSTAVSLIFMERHFRLNSGT